MTTKNLLVKSDPIKAAWEGASQCRNCGIRHLALFADLQEGDFTLIHEPIEDLHYKAGTVLYRPGEPPTHVFTVRSGLLKLTQYLAGGTQRIVRLLKQGDVAGLEAVLGEAYQHAAMALQPVDVCRIPVTAIQRLDTQTPRLHYQLMQRWQRALQEADTWLTELSTGTARARVARLLLRQAEASADGTFELLGREDVGAILGMTTETASRVIADYKRSGYVQDVNGGWVRADLSALAGIARN